MNLLLYKEIEFLYSVHLEGDLGLGLVKNNRMLMLRVQPLGMISHKMSLLTIFDHKHFMQKFHQKFGIFHEKFSTVSDFGSYLVSNFKF